MNDAEHDRLLELALAITDETPVDWDATATPEPDGRLECLRLIEAVAAGHREPGPAAPGAAAPLFTWGPLRALESLGQGTFGEVYRAWDPALQREVALKLRRAHPGETPDGAFRWLEEARRLARVRHPNVLVVHGADLHNGRAGIWTDLLRGRTLEADLAERGALGPREAALIGLDLCAALAAVHAAGLVHGDVKTTNVMREGAAAATAGAHGAGRIVLMDFGSAHESASPGRGAPPGTPLASAPEVLEGAPATPAADLYSLGVLLYRLVTARYPVSAASVAELREKLERGERARLRDARPDLPYAFVEVVERALESDPARRFASAAEMEHALAATIAAGARARSRRAFAWATAAVAAVALVAAIVVATRPRRTGVEETSAVRAPAGATSSAEGGVSASAPAVPGGAVAARDQTPSIALEVEATLFRAATGAPERLESGGRVAPGDRLFLEIEGREPLHVYVLNEDRTGSVTLLFPVPGVDLSNPLAAGAAHRLPGRRGAADLDWQVTSAGGRETFLIVASREPVAEMEREAARLPAAREGEPIAYAPVDPEALLTLRGVTGLAPAAPSESSARGPRLAALSRRLAAAARGGAGLWQRMVQLENPER